MKLQKGTTYIMSVIALLSFIGTIVFTIIDCSWVNSFCWTIFGGSIIAVIIALITYFNERKNVEFEIFTDLCKIVWKLNHYNNLDQNYSKSRAIAKYEILTEIDEIVSTSLMVKIYQYSPFFRKKKFKSIYSSYESLNKFCSSIKNDLMSLQGIHYENYVESAIVSRLEKIEALMTIKTSYFSNEESISRIEVQFILYDKLVEYLNNYITSILNYQKREYKNLEL